MYTFKVWGPQYQVREITPTLYSVYNLQWPRMLYNALPAYSMQLHVEERAYPRDNCEIVC